MGEDVKFEQQINAGMIKDEKIIERASKGPDIYCAYCGNRNPAGAKTCSRCGADLSEGKEREHGSQHSAHLDENADAAPLICPACGSENPAGTLKCRTCGAPLSGASREKEEIPVGQPVNTGKKGAGRGCLMIILFIVIFGFIAMMMMNGCGSGGSGGIFSGTVNTPVPNQFLSAVVSAQNWQTSVQVIGPVEAKDSAWEENVPDDARNVRCQDKNATPPMRKNRIPWKSAVHHTRSIWGTDTSS